MLMHNYKTDETISEALALYPAPGTPGSPFATQYDRASTMSQEMVFGCMYELPYLRLILLIDGLARDWFFAERLQQRGAKNVFTFR